MYQHTISNYCAKHEQPVTIDVTPDSSGTKTQFVSLIMGKLGYVFVYNRSIIRIVYTTVCLQMSVVSIYS